MKRRKEDKNVSLLWKMIQIKTRLLYNIKLLKHFHRILCGIVVFLLYTRCFPFMQQDCGFGKGSVKRSVDLDPNGSSQAFKAAGNVFEKSVILFLNLDNQRGKEKETLNEHNLINVVVCC